MNVARQKAAKVDVERAKNSPADEFDHPQEAVENPSIAERDKKRF